jgi:hypothetical protein
MKKVALCFGFLFYGISMGEAKTKKGASSEAPSSPNIFNEINS